MTSFANENIHRSPIAVLDRRLPNVSVFGAVYREIRDTVRVQRRISDARISRVYAANDEEEILRNFREDLII